MNDTKIISTQDMYEAAYYLTLGGNVEDIEIVNHRTMMGKKAEMITDDVIMNNHLEWIQ